MKHLTWLLGSTALVLGMWACGGGDDGRGGDDEPDDPDCGNKVCERGESQTSCPGDCVPQSMCNGNNVCDAGETSTTCPADCHVCGNNVCEAGENTSCPMDCPAILKTVNNSSYPIYTLYVAKCSDTTWGIDQTGSNYIAVGATYTLTSVPPGCYQFRAENSSTKFWQSQPYQIQPSSTFTWTLTN